MLLQHSVLVWTCPRKCATYLSPVLVPIHHESSRLLDLQTCSFVVYTPREYFDFKPGMGRALFHEIDWSDTDKSHNLFLLRQQKEHLVETPVGSTLIAEQQTFLQQMGIQRDLDSV